MQRSQIRQQMRQKRAQLAVTDKEQAAARIVARLLHHPVLQRSQKISGYLATEGEVNIHDWFTQAWQQSKHCYLPVLVDQQLLFAPYHKATTLISNRWGILEPETNTLIPPSTLEAVIVPLVAFDTQGNRLGRGAGYYDRSFAFLRNQPSIKKPYLIGVGYTFQQVPVLTPSDWDVPLQAVITDTKTF